MQFCQRTLTNRLKHYPVVLTALNSDVYSAIGERRPLLRPLQDV